VRVPAHPAARALIEAAGTPVAAPSANPFGYVSPTTAAHVAELLGSSVDLVLDGGPCRVGVESTILSLAGGAPVILRPGGVSREALEEAWASRLQTAGTAETPLAPGQLPRHYATRTPLRVLPGPAGGPPGAGAGWGSSPSARERPPRATPRSRCWPPTASPETAAARLFAALRRLDAAGLDLILAEPCDEAGLGHAIMDRLRRAAAPGPTARPGGRAGPARTVPRRVDELAQPGLDVGRKRREAHGHRTVPETWTTLA
jgi:L-threonylcarbamoyladenylate synthase